MLNSIRSLEKWRVLLCLGNYNCYDFFYENNVGLSRHFESQNEAKEYVDSFVHSDDIGWEICDNGDFTVEYINWEINGQPCHALVYQLPQTRKESK